MIPKKVERTLFCSGTFQIWEHPFWIGGRQSRFGGRRFGDQSHSLTNPKMMYIEMNEVFQILRFDQVSNFKGPGRTVVFWRFAH